VLLRHQKTTNSTCTEAPCLHGRKCVTSKNGSAFFSLVLGSAAQISVRGDGWIRRGLYIRAAPGGELVIPHYSFTPLLPTSFSHITLLQHQLPSKHACHHTRPRHAESFGQHVRSTIAVFFRVLAQIICRMGAMLLGILVSAILYGMSLIQSLYYYTRMHTSSVWLHGIDQRSRLSKGFPLPPNTGESRSLVHSFFLCLNVSRKVAITVIFDTAHMALITHTSMCLTRFPFPCDQYHHTSSISLFDHKLLVCLPRPSFLSLIKICCSDPLALEKMIWSVFSFLATIYV
jgi:hypothetical protein